MQLHKESLVTGFQLSRVLHSHLSSSFTMSFIATNLPHLDVGAALSAHAGGSIAPVTMDANVVDSVGHADGQQIQHDSLVDSSMVSSSLHCFCSFETNVCFA